MKKTTIIWLCICIWIGSFSLINYFDNKGIEFSEYSPTTQSNKELKSYYITFSDINELNEFVSSDKKRTNIWDNIFATVGYPAIRINDIDEESLTSYVRAYSVKSIQEVHLHEVMQQNTPDTLLSWYHSLLGDVSLCEETLNVWLKLWIVDTWFDISHEDLAYIDWYDVFDWDNDPSVNSNSDKHGTVMAWAADAISNNWLGIKSMSLWKPQSIFIKAWEGSFITNHWEWIAKAYDLWADVISMAFGRSWECEQWTQDFLNFFHDKWVTLVAAAWNQNSPVPISPANCENVISVWAIDDTMNLTSFSAHWADICAPWSLVDATIPYSAYQESYWGTSTSASIIAWIIASWVDPFEYTVRSQDNECNIVNLTLCNGVQTKPCEEWYECSEDSDCWEWVCEEKIKEAYCKDWAWKKCWFYQDAASCRSAGWTTPIEWEPLCIWTEIKEKTCICDICEEVITTIDSFDYNDNWTITAADSSHLLKVILWQEEKNVWKIYDVNGDWIFDREDVNTLNLYILKENVDLCIWGIDTDCDGIIDKSLCDKKSLNTSDESTNWKSITR